MQRVSHKPLLSIKSSKVQAWKIQRNCLSVENTVLLYGERGMIQNLM